MGPFTVLTAAHCKYGNKWEGRANRTPTEVRVPGWGRTKIVDTLKDPEYNGHGMSQARTFEGDLLLVYTEDELPLDRIIPVAETPNGCFPELIAQGYGRDETGKGGILRERIVYETDRNRRRDMIWTTAACNKGDSGGPLYAETPTGLTVIGALSASRDTFTDKDCLYVDLYEAKEWIDENTY